MSECYVIVPVKRLDDAKSRLRQVLSPDERVSLSLEMLSRVLGALRGVPDLKVVVVSSDSRALELADRAGAVSLTDRWSGINRSLEGAAEWCVQQGASQLLVVHSDLPLLTSADIKAMMGMAETPRSLVLAPCHRDEGTNALLVRPPDLVPFAFGLRSFQGYLHLAREAGVEARIYRSESVALDIDTEEDLHEFLSRAPACQGSPI